MADSNELIIKAWSVINSDEVRQVVDLINTREDAIRVIQTFRKSISYACDAQREKASSETIKRLDDIVASLDNLEKKATNGDVEEKDFIKESLWLCLEGVVIVMTNAIGLNYMSSENSAKLSAVANLAFEFFRMKIYDNEYNVVSRCLKHQKELNDKLSKELDEYMDQLRDELEHFDSLVSMAFSGNMKTSFAASKQLAESEGVKDDEILCFIEDVDRIFS